METQTSRNHPRSDGLVPGSANATAGPPLGVKQLVAAVDWRAPPRPRALCPSKKRDVMPTPNKKPGIPSTACAIGRSGECFPRQAPFDCSSNLPGINSKKVCRRARRPGELGAAALPVEKRKLRPEPSPHPRPCPHRCRACKPDPAPIGGMVSSGPRGTVYTVVEI